MKEISHISTTYTSELVHKNKLYDSKKCNGIIFENIGTIDAVVDSIPVTSSDKERPFLNENPLITMDQKWAINFTDDTSVNAKMLVIRVYKEIHYKK